jgi:hypothetical protein
MVPLLLLLLLCSALSTGAAMVLFVIRLRKHRRKAEAADLWDAADRVEDTSSYWQFARRPECWLAIKSDRLFPVQSALGLHDGKPCSWFDGLDQTLFIAPPVRGWVLVLGSGLPNPSEDVDLCYRFVLELSRKLGQVQLFSASTMLNHHAWVKADSGRVIRAYAWAGRTVWKEGARTAAERDLGIQCFDYTDGAEQASFSQPDVFAANVDKVSLLAARWSVDPARIEGTVLAQAQGIAGDPFKRHS